MVRTNELTNYGERREEMHDGLHHTLHVDLIMAEYSGHAA
jgi:hypothetical protein